jgi:O-antigen ligase
VEGYDNRGHMVWYGDVNYIHNLYLFLLFKLGLIGTVAVLAALALWIGWAIRSTLRLPHGERRAFLAATAAIWIGYCVWALTSPELIDFSMAPLFGLLVAASADAGEA